MTAMIAAASQQNITLNHAKKIEKKFIQNDSSQIIRLDKCFKEKYEKISFFITIKQTCHF
jgi:hypothetical protein